MKSLRRNAAYLHSIAKLIIKHDIFSIALLLSIVILFAYKDLPGIYFLNDEWLHISSIYVHGLGAGLSDFSILQILGGKERPLGNIIYNIFITRFGLEPLPFVFLFYILHWINSLLCYVLAKRITRSSGIAAGAALFFAVSGRSEQALSWIGAGVQTLLSTTMMMLSLKAFYEFIDTKRSVKLFFSILWIYVAFLCKEQAAIMIFVLPVIYLFECRGKRNLEIPKKYWLICIALCVLLLQPFLTRYHISFGQMPLLIHQEWFQHAVFNSFYIPFLALGQFFIPYELMYRIAHWFFTFTYPFMALDPNAESIEHMILSDVFSFVTALLFLFVISYTMIKIKYLRRALYTCLSFFFILTLPLALVLFKRESSYVESRYVYFITFPFSIMLSSIVYEGIQWCNRRKYFRTILVSIVIILYGCFLYKNALVAAREVRLTSIRSREIRSGFNLFRTIDYLIPDNPIFYVTSDREYYYPNNFLPFQLGSGFMLMMAYYPKGIIPNELMEKKFLWSYTSQGYEEADGKGFGYFWNKKDILALYQRNDMLLPEQLIGLNYNSKEQTIENISSDIQDYVRRNRYVYSTY